MALNIRNPETEALAAELARLTGENKTRAIAQALRERIERIRRTQPRPRTLIEELDEIALRCAALPVLDDSSEDEILGYNEHGLFD